MNKRTRWILYASIVVLYVLHNDIWFWYDPRVVLGLPIGLTYHVGYNIAATVLMFLLVRFAWPSHLEVEVGDTAAGAAAGAAAVDNSSRGTGADAQTPGGER